MIIGSMPDKVPFADEIKGRFDTSNRLFSLGVDVGVKSFSQLITISSVALGLLFSYRQGFFGHEPESFFLTSSERFFWSFSVLAFGITVIAAIRRNYHAGNGLVFKADYVRSRAHKKINPENDDYGKNEKVAISKMYAADGHRKYCSFIAKFSFYWGLTSMMLFFLYSDFVVLLQWAIDGLRFVGIEALIAGYASASVALILNILVSIFFAKSTGIKDSVDKDGDKN